MIFKLAIFFIVIGIAKLIIGVCGRVGAFRNGK